ncbi:MAG: hypothetical protein WKF77_28535 [Planctomycetaceae bacterium]
MLSNRFQGGMIYSTPATGAHEIHGDILGKWESLGFERSFLGYPKTDEIDFPEGGRVSAFERGTIYWWPDTGAIELNDVVVHYTGLVCFSETDSDQLSDSDEPYVVLGVVAPTGSSATRSKIYEDVDGGESRPDLLEVYRGKPGGLAFSVLLMEHDEDDPDKYKRRCNPLWGRRSWASRGDHDHPRGRAGSCHRRRPAPLCGCADRRGRAQQPA